MIPKYPNGYNEEEYKKIVKFLQDNYSCKYQVETIVCKGHFSFFLDGKGYGIQLYPNTTLESFKKYFKKVLTKY